MEKIIFLIFLVLLFFSFSQEAKAAPLSGWAWSENIGWISVNSRNCDVNGNGTYQGAAEGAPTGCPSSGTVFPYNLDVNPSGGVFSSTSYAWSENIGWIWFVPTDIPPGETAANPARLNPDNTVSGWARACAGAVNADCTGGASSGAGGWDGWIQLRDTTPISYGVSRDTVPNPDELTGWAWGGGGTGLSDSVIGWISFRGPGYKVSFFNNPPNPPSALSATQGDYCAGSLIGSAPITLGWTFSDPDAGDTQSAYQVQVDDEATFTAPFVVDSGKVFSSSNSYAPPGLSFNTTYYWRVMVWDSSDAPSSFAVGPSFTTSSRPPAVNFTFSPPSPGVGEIVNFTNQTICYDSLGNPTLCVATWAWDFQNDGVTDSTLQNPTFTYTTAGPYTVKLTTTDSIGSCSATKPLTVTVLPKWKEIPPTSWLEKLFAALLKIFFA